MYLHHGTEERMEAMELIYKSEDWKIEREKHNEGETYYIKHGDKVIDQAPTFEEAYPLPK